MAVPSPEVVGEGLAIRRGRRLVVEAPAIHLPVGITAIVGANGSGKSSLLRTLATVAPPASGQLSIDGRDVRSRPDLRAARRSLGYLPQAWDLPAGTRVIDALRHGAWLHRVAEPEAAIDRVLDDLALRGHRTDLLSRLSGGTHRRVAIAQASLHRPRILLLDEPTAGLDLGQRTRLWRWLAEHARDGVVAVVTHDVDEVVAHADQVVVVADGVAGRLDAPDHATVAAAVS